LIAYFLETSSESFDLLLLLRDNPMAVLKSAVILFLRAPEPVAVLAFRADIAVAKLIFAIRQAKNIDACTPIHVRRKPSKPSSRKSFLIGRRNAYAAQINGRPGLLG
jgi:hypothetical protein